MIGAGDGVRTRDIDLGKVALYQLSHSRVKVIFISGWDKPIPYRFYPY